MTITVVQVFRLLGVEPEPELTWSIGSMMAAEHVRLHGVEPPKELRPKTNAGGTHCMAIYPDDWLPKIRDAILAVERSRAAQGDLFGP